MLLDQINIVFTIQNLHKQQNMKENVQMNIWAYRLSVR